jgi:hypothetical protein
VATRDGADSVGRADEAQPEGEGRCPPCRWHRR